MTDEAILAIIVYIIFTFLFAVSELVVVGALTKDQMYLVRPKLLYDISEMNMFGCYAITALCCVLNPYGGLFRLKHFVFTVGRKSQVNFKSKIAEDDAYESDSDV